MADGAAGWGNVIKWKCNCHMRGVMKLADGVKLSKWRYNCQMGMGKIVDRK